MTNEQISDNPNTAPERKPRGMGHATATATAPEIPTTPKNTNEFQDKFLQMGSDTKHIVAQTDRIAAHLLDGPTGERRNAALTLVAQVEQIGRNQVLLIHLVEQMLERLPPVQVQGDPSKLQ